MHCDCPVDRYGLLCEFSSPRSADLGDDVIRGSYQADQGQGGQLSTENSSPNNKNVLHFNGDVIYDYTDNGTNVERMDVEFSFRTNVQSGEAFFHHVQIILRQFWKPLNYSFLHLNISRLILTFRHSSVHRRS